MLVGRPPFSGEKPIAIALQHMHSRVPSLSDLCPKVPPVIVRLVLRMTEPAPERRPTTAREVLSELERLTPEDLIAAHPRSRRARRRRIWLGTAVVTGALVAATTAMLNRSPVAWTDPRADGVIELTVMSRPVTGVVGGELFLDAVVSTIEKRLSQPEVHVRAVDPAFLDDHGRLTMLGFEHLLELTLLWSSTEQGRIYQVQAQLIELSGSEVIWQQTSPELPVLDFAGVEVVSGQLLQASFYSPAESSPAGSSPAE